MKSLFKTPFLSDGEPRVFPTWGDKTARLLPWHWSSWDKKKQDSSHAMQIAHPQLCKLPRASLWPNHEKSINFYKTTCVLQNAFHLNPQKFASKTGFCSSIAITVNLKSFLIRPSEPCKASRGNSGTTRPFKTNAWNSQLQFGKMYSTTTASQ